MAAILIQPFDITTVGKLSATITGIDPTDHDCLLGTVDGKPARWNSDGTARDWPSAANIDVTDSEVMDALATLDAIK